MRFRLAQKSGRTCLAVAVAASMIAAMAIGPARGEAMTRVAGGQEMGDRFPWQVALVLSPSKHGGNAASNQFCSGALIHPYVVITAATCIHRNHPSNGGDLHADDIRVLIGGTTLSGSSGLLRAVSNVWSLLPGTPTGFNRRPFDPAAHVNDYTYLTLPSPATEAPIQIAGPGERKLWGRGRDAWVAGWGATSLDGERNGALNASLVEIYSDAACRQRYGGVFVPTAMVCAGYHPGGRGACEGDDGAPLQSPALGGIFRLSGIVSLRHCGLRRTGDVYVRLADDAIRNSIVSDLQFIEGFEVLPHWPVVGEGALLPYRCNGLPATIAGTRGHDVIHGTPGNDVIVGLGGRDTIYGGGGNDTICGGPGADFLFGGPGNDVILGERGSDLIVGGPGSNICIGGPGPGRNRIRGC